MKVDAEGQYCTGPEGCWVFDASGNHLGTIRLPEIPANCAWAGLTIDDAVYGPDVCIYAKDEDAGTPIPRAA